VTRVMTQESPPEEVDLMQRIAARDQMALAEFYDRFGDLIYGMTLRVLQNQTLAEEAMQDTLMKVWNLAARWEPERSKLVSWLLTLARYTAIDRLRKEQRQSPWTAIGLEDLLNLISQTRGVEQSWWDDRHQIEQLIQRLPPEQVEAIDLAFFRGMTHVEIADHLKQPLGTIKSRIRHGLMMLKELWLQAEK
jgi:RNA polymerase sigma-70 factor, ECF subfamily